MYIEHSMYNIIIQRVGSLEHVVQYFYTIWLGKVCKVYYHKIES